MDKMWKVAAIVLLPAFVHAFSVEEIHGIYRSRLLTAPASVQEIGDYVFIIQEGPDDSFTDEAGGINAVVLKGQLEALEKYIGKSTGKNVSPFSDSVTEQLVEVSDIRIPECKSCRVDQIRSIGRYRHVTAYDAGPLRKAREEAQKGLPVTRTVDEWAKLISRKLKAVGGRAERARLWASIGAVEPLVANFGGAVWELNGVDSIAVNRLLGRWKGNEDRKGCFAALSLCPAFIPAHSRLAELYEKGDELVKALSRRLKCGMDQPDFKAVEGLCSLLASNCNNVCWNQYSALYKNVVLNSTVMRDRRGTPFEYEVNSFGHLEYASRDHGAQDRARALFEKAVEFFSAGKDLPKILQLLSQSLQLDPANPVAWRYYGAALRTDGKLNDALIAYNQAVSMRHDDFRALAALCGLYEKLGCREMAVGCAWYVYVESTDDEVRKKVRPLLGE